MAGRNDEAYPFPTASTDRRSLLRTGAGLTLAAPALMVSGCSSFVFPDLAATKPLTDLDKDRPYKPVDPAHALAVINAYRAQNGIAPMRIDSRLNETATAYARRMGEADQLSHEIGGTLRARLNASGYSFGVAGENIGVGYRDFDEVFEGWKRSPAHDRGMKDTDMTLMGIGSYYDRKTRWQTFWCVQFSRPKG